MTGRWLKYFLAGTLVGMAVLLQLPFRPWGWGTIPGLWLCLLVGTRWLRPQWEAAIVGRCAPSA